MVRDAEPEGRVGRDAGEPETPRHEADLPVGQPGRRSEVGKERGESADRERAGEGVEGQEHDQGRRAHGRPFYELLGWAADRNDLRPSPLYVSLTMRFVLTARVTAAGRGDRRPVGNRERG